MAVAIICEYNPFHNGHKYLIETVKSITNEPVLAVMSGSFTQRGEVAVCSKFSRTKVALENGADLVVELPVVFAVSNAERFAGAGVEISKAFDCVSHLAFGCETNDISLLTKASSVFENSDVRSLIKEYMNKGEYYPRAVENAVRMVMGEAVANIFTKPNNILAVEYIRNLKHSNIDPLPVNRIGTAHDSNIASNSFACASHIRSLVRNNENVSNYVPFVPSDITFTQNLERITLYKLRSMSVSDFAKLPDVSEGLENRIFNAVNHYNSLEEIILNIKTKRYTHARIRRIITCALLGITEELQHTPIEYVRVLGFTDKGADLLKHCNKSIVTSVSKGLKMQSNIVNLLKKDIYATDISALAYDFPKNMGTDFTTKLVTL